MSVNAPEMTKITVITVVLNNETTIEDTIRSVLSQTYPHVEYIVIDGASTDNTLNIVDRYRRRISRILSLPDRGLYDALNKGIGLATGDVIGILHSDDVYADQSVLQHVASVFADPSVHACYSDLVYVSKRNPDRIVRYWKSCPYREGLFNKGWMPAHPTFFVRKEIYDRYGRFDLKAQPQADFELTMRFLAIHNIKSIYIPKIMVKMRTGGGSSKLSFIVKGNISAYRSCKRHAIPVSPFFVVTKVLSRIPQFFFRPKR